MISRPVNNKTTHTDTDGEERERERHSSLWTTLLTLLTPQIPLWHLTCAAGSSLGEQLCYVTTPQLSVQQQHRNAALTLLSRSAARKTAWHHNRVCFGKRRENWQSGYIICAEYTAVLQFIQVQWTCSLPGLYFHLLYISSSWCQSRDYSGLFWIIALLQVFTLKYNSLTVVQTRPAAPSYNIWSHNKGGVVGAVHLADPLLFHCFWQGQ